jgi:hypothetical protein
LVDMGPSGDDHSRPDNTGSGHGARFQLRVGTALTLADLPSVAHVANAGGVVRLELTTPARGRYVLARFTSLPPDPAGTFQTSVYSIQLEGRI